MCLIFVLWCNGLILNDKKDCRELLRCTLGRRVDAGRGLLAEGYLDLSGKRRVGKGGFVIYGFLALSLPQLYGLFWKCRKYLNLIYMLWP